MGDPREGATRAQEALGDDRAAGKVAADAEPEVVEVAWAEAMRKRDKGKMAEAHAELVGCVSASELVHLDDDPAIVWANLAEVRRLQGLSSVDTARDKRRMLAAGIAAELQLVGAEVSELDTIIALTLGLGADYIGMVTVRPGRRTVRRRPSSGPSVDALDGTGRWTGRPSDGGRLDGTQSKMYFRIEEIIEIPISTKPFRDELDGIPVLIGHDSRSAEVFFCGNVRVHSTSIS
ncbi:hypothetical protein DFH08DRAFT_1014755 [Mycena albidolilacea]|uniref:Uncharacterized protein n=1 Tax=Mycena albidolilacea TaxID=1033008 RepID=A0AAD6ZT00_9AGAR|nr:hypothetical protein DFH08DRAFT_1014755 [Mycena albidolilacea]